MLSKIPVAPTLQDSWKTEEVVDVVSISDAEHDN